MPYYIGIGKNFIYFLNDNIVLFVAANFTTIRQDMFSFIMNLRKIQKKGWEKWDR